MKRKTVIFLSAIIFSVLSGGVAFACDFCLLSQGISPLDTVRGAGIRVVERYTRLKSVYRGAEKISNPGAEEKYWTTELTGFFAITGDTTLQIVVPLRKTEADAHLHVHPDGTLEAERVKAREFGLGDMAVLGRHVFLKKHAIDTTLTAALVAGIKFPTGKTDAKTGDGAEYLDSHLQPGTGSWDFLLGLSASHAVRKFSLSANLLGVVTTEGEAGDIKHRFGNALNYDLTGKFRVYPEEVSPSAGQVFLALGLNGELRGREEERPGGRLKNSGGHTVYLSPGVQLVMTPNLVLEASYQHAVYHNLHGTQMGEDHKAIGGMTYLF